jgi:predicted enzyme related to lactoylglutathione lyase
VEVCEAYVSYQASDFDATCRFYERVLGLERVLGWDRVDGRGAYFAGDRVTVVEITGSPRGERGAGLPPVDGGLAVTIMVRDLSEALAQIVERGGVIDLAVAEHEWGCYFGVRDPDGVRVYIMERRGAAADQAREHLALS